MYTSFVMYHQVYELLIFNSLFRNIFEELSSFIDLKISCLRSEVFLTSSRW